MRYWEQWKRIKTKHDNLVRLGIDTSKAWEFANTRKGSWCIAGSVILKHALSNECLEKLGYPSVSRRLSLAY